jgi:hypothetical protein
MPLQGAQETFENFHDVIDLLEDRNRELRRIGLLSGNDDAKFPELNPTFRVACWWYPHKPAGVGCSVIG